MKELIQRKRNILLLLIPLGIFCTELAKRSGMIAEWVFARGIYPVYSHIVAILTGWIPFSLAELAVTVGIPVLTVLIVCRGIRAVKKKGQRFLILMTGVQNLLCLTAVLFFVYVIGCGVNYYRYPVSVYLNLEVQDSTVDELSGLVTELAIEASALREQLGTVDERGVYVLPMTESELGKEAKKAYGILAEEYSVFSGDYPAPKPVFFSRLMSYTEITGVFTCWTMEANVNIDIPPYSIGMTMCHELAHLQGFMREDEANYIAILACRRSDSLDLRYSGTVMALLYAGNALYGKNADLYFEICQKYYGDGVIRDFRANSEYWAQFENTKTAEVANKVNDTYLKANEQEDGVQSYGRVVDLLLAEYRNRKADSQKEQ